MVNTVCKDEVSPLANALIVSSGTVFVTSHTKTHANDTPCMTGIPRRSRVTPVRF